MFCKAPSSSGGLILHIAFGEMDLCVRPDREEGVARSIGVETAHTSGIVAAFSSARKKCQTCQQDGKQECHVLFHIFFKGLLDLLLFCVAADQDAKSIKHPDQRTPLVENLYRFTNAFVTTPSSVITRTK